jgi:hypothetical protein
MIGLLQIKDIFLFAQIFPQMPANSMVCSILATIEVKNPEIIILNALSYPCIIPVMPI